MENLTQFIFLNQLKIDDYSFYKELFDILYDVYSIPVWSNPENLNKNVIICNNM